MNNRCSWLSLVLCSSLLVGCPAHNIPALTDPHHQFGESDTERELLEEARALRAEFERKGMLLPAPELTGYVDAMAQRLARPETRALLTLNVHVLRSAAANAFATPGGDIYLAAGLLAQLDNQAQLAMVVAHELAHVELRHALKSYENRRSSVIAAHVADLLLLGSSLGYLPFIASISSYSREQEREADRSALRAVLAAGYDAQAAISLFDLLAAANPASAAASKWSSSHPGHRERIAALRELARAHQRPGPQGGTEGEDGYRAARREILSESIRLFLRARTYRLGYETAIRAQSDFPNVSWPLVAAGEAQRLMADDPASAASEEAARSGRSSDAALEHAFAQRREEFLDAAAQRFTAAMRLDSEDAEALRGLGLVHWMRGERSLAQPLLHRYLERRPQARDRLYIASLLSKGEAP